MLPWFVGCQALLVLDSKDKPFTDAAAPDRLEDAAGVEDEASITVDAPTADAGPGGPRCDPNKPFGIPQPLPPFNRPNRSEGSARLSDDELTMYLDRDGLLSRAQWSAATQSWSEPTPLMADVSIPSSAGQPFVRGSDIYFHGVFGSEKPRIFRATLAGLTLKNATPLVAINNSDDSVDPWLLPSGVVYFARFVVGGVQVLRSDSDSTSSPPGQVMLQHSDPVSPVVNAKETVIYYSATTGDGGSDVFRATGNGAGRAFGSAERQNTLSSTREEFVRWVSADDYVVHLLRRDGIEQADIFRAARPL